MWAGGRWLPEEREHNYWVKLLLSHVHILPVTPLRLCRPASRPQITPRVSIIGVPLATTIRHAFSPGAHWISCSSAKCSFARELVCLQVFPARVTVHSQPDSPVRMVRGCRHRCGDRRQHTLAYAGQQVLLMCEIAHVVQKRSSDICLVWDDAFQQTAAASQSGIQLS